MVKEIKQFFNTLLTKWLEDIFILIGISIIIGITYVIKPVLSIYMLGGFFVLLGLILAKR